MRLYHGSNCKIYKVDLTLSRQYMDFGKGFYLTPDFQRAVTMANRTTTLKNEGTPEITSFIFYKSKCPQDLKIKEFKTCTGEWAKFIMCNRDRTLSSAYNHGYDIVIGPVADSRVDKEIDNFRKEFEKDFLFPDNLKVLAKRLRYPGKSYIQYTFCTERALEYLIRD